MQVEMVVVVEVEVEDEGGKGKRKKEKGKERSQPNRWWRLFSQCSFVWRSVHSNYVFRLEHRWLNGNRSLATLLI